MSNWFKYIMMLRTTKWTLLTGFSLLCNHLVFAQTTVSSGISVCGQVYMTDTVGVFGDIYLDEAEQEGQGVLALCDTKPQLLVSKHSTLNNLLIKNPTKVTLIGDLTVLRSLTINKGIFDAQKGFLVLSTTTTLIIHNGGVLLRNIPLSIDFQNNSDFYLLKAIITSIDLPKKTCTSLNKEYMTNIDIFYKLEQNDVFRPPPQADIDKRVAQLI